MKKIGIILLVIVGTLTTPRAEIIYFEKKTSDFYQAFSDEKKAVDLSSKLINDIIDLGTIRIETGEFLEIHSRKYIRGHQRQAQREYGGGPGKFLLEVNYDNFDKPEKIQTSWSFSSRKWGTSYYNQAYDSSSAIFPIEGPATIKVKLQVSVFHLWFGGTWGVHQPEQYFRIAFKKGLSDFGTPNNQLQALVLPKGVQGMSVIMESSDDLVNWTRDTLGRKPTANRPKFFRLRAVKE
jgi:hypothetical protein